MTQLVNGNAMIWRREPGTESILVTTMVTAFLKKVTSTHRGTYKVTQGPKGESKNWTFCFGSPLFLSSLERVWEITYPLYWVLETCRSLPGSKSISQNINKCLHHKIAWDIRQWWLCWHEGIFKHACLEAGIRWQVIMLGHSVVINL